MKAEDGIGLKRFHRGGLGTSGRPLTKREELALGARADGMTYREIGKLMDLAEGSVRDLLRRARRKDHGGSGWEF